MNKGTTHIRGHLLSVLAILAIACSSAPAAEIPPVADTYTDLDTRTERTNYGKSSIVAVAKHRMGLIRACGDLNAGLSGATFQAMPVSGNAPITTQGCP